ncbi:terminase [Pseudoalteromonas sp. Of7M-16]|uniref:terminase n=1 Tax=Pseudoalteromonas sp. Of7M-16 TaxID=2917756 RepID=UPI001EF61C7C|nr:terminase [Pseudoalteromonas sp. Of7M-16]MCG7550892.1 terminase [Pseudoalteromonas sp. Of7M-16]
MKLKSINQDPRYLDFCKRYRSDWVRASVELFGKWPSPQQYQLLTSVQKTACRVSVSSGHGTGKSDMSSIITMIYMFFYPESRIVLVANKIGQVKAAVFKYIKKNFKTVCKRFPWIAQYFVVTETEFYAVGYKGVWCVLTKGYRLGNEEGLAGEHGKHLLYIVDEASGLSDKAIDIMEGALTEDDNRMLMLSQPTRNTGRFYDSHHKLSKDMDPKDGIWSPLKFNSEFSQWVNLQYLKNAAFKFGGRESAQYMIKVRGEFPKVLEGFLISSSDFDRAANKANTPTLDDDWGWVALCDVGNGRDKSVMLIGKVCGWGLERKFIPVRIEEMEGNISPVDFGRRIKAHIASHDYPNITVAIDSDGVGSDTAQIAEELGLRVQRIRWGHSCFNDFDKENYVNQRAYANIMAHRAMTSGRMLVDGSPKTKDQAVKIPYIINDQGQYQIVKKETMREKMNIPSPDRWDTYCFSQLVQYVPANTRIDEDLLDERNDLEDLAASSL